MQFSDRLSATALFDTGAAVSLLSRRAFQAAKQAGAVGDEIPNHGVTLTTASGEPLPTLGAFHISFALLGRRKCSAPMVVASQLNSDAIMGMNIIEREGIVYDPITKQCFFSESTPPEQDWGTASIQVSEEVIVQPLQARLTRCILRKSDGSRVGPNTKFIGTLMGLPVAAVTDTHGAACMYITNPDMQELVLQRRYDLGLAEEDAQFSEVPLTEDSIAEIFASMLPTKAVGAVGTTRGKPRPSPVSVPPEVKSLIANQLRATVPDAWFDRYYNLLLSYADIISASPTDLGSTDTVVHDIKLRDREPVWTKQFTLPVDESDLIRLNVRDWLKIGIIEPAQSLYNSPLFCVRKKDGGLRVVLDYRKLNAKTLPDRYSIRGVDECIREVGYSGSTIFSTLDLTAGFWQMKLQPAARPYTAFTVPGMGQFQWRTSPMGLTGCPASFSRLMDITMRNVPNVITYIDDVLVHSRDLDQHHKHLHCALNRLRDNNLKLNIVKCHFATDSVAYLGHQLTAAGVRPGIDKAAAMQHAAPPVNMKEVQSFLGLANYFRGYIKDFAIVASPLYALTRQDAEWKQGPLPPDALQAFRKIQHVMSSGPVLQFSNRNGKYHLYVDSATGKFDGTGPEGGLGAVLMQEAPDGTKGVIGYASRRLQIHERNYSPYLLELQACVYGIEYFEAYLKNRSFVLYTDHKPLIRLSPVHEKTLNRLDEKMTHFFFEMRYINGKDNHVADYLSRTAGDGCAAVEESTTLFSQLQHADPQLLRWIQYLKGDNTVTNGELHPLITQMGVRHDVLYLQVSGRKGFMDKGAYRIVVPTSMRGRFLKEAHDSMIGGHGGFFKTAERLKQLYWWPGMDQDIAAHVAECTVCQRGSNKGRPPIPPLHSIPLPRKPNDRVHVDLFGPLQDEDSDKKYVCVMTDAFTKIVRLSVLTSKSAEEVANSILQNWIYIYGVPKEIITDQGKEFNNSFAKTLWTGLGINHHTTTPYHPQTNSQAEVFNKTMKAFLIKVRIQAKEDTVHWSKYIGPLMFSHNTAVHKATLTTPFYAMFGYDPRAQEWPEGRVLDFETEDLTGNPLAQLHRTTQIVRATARHNNQHAQEAAQRAHARAHRTRTTKFFPDQPIWVQLHATNEVNKKLADQWEEGEIVEQVSPESWKVLRLQRRRRRYATINVFHLKPRSAEKEAEAEADLLPIPPPPLPDPQNQDGHLRRRTRRLQRPAPASPAHSDTDSPPSSDHEDEDEDEYLPPTRHLSTPPPSTRPSRTRTRRTLQAVEAILAAAREDGDLTLLDFVWRLLNSTDPGGNPYCLRGLGRVQLAPPGPAAPPPVPVIAPGPAPPRNPTPRRRHRSAEERERARLEDFLPPGAKVNRQPLPLKRPAKGRPVTPTPPPPPSSPKRKGTSQLQGPLTSPIEEEQFLSPFPSPDSAQFRPIPAPRSLTPRRPIPPGALPTPPPHHLPWGPATPDRPMTPTDLRHALERLSLTPRAGQEQHQFGPVDPGDLQRELSRLTEEAAAGFSTPYAGLHRDLRRLTTGPSTESPPSFPPSPTSTSLPNSPPQQQRHTKRKKFW